MNPKCEKCNKYRDGCDGSDKFVISDCFEEIDMGNVKQAPPIPERSVVPEKKIDEPISEKHKNFRRILEKRLKNLCEDFRKIGNLGSGNYHYIQEDVDMIEERIKAIYTKTMYKFKKVKG